MYLPQNMAAYFFMCFNASVEDTSVKNFCGSYNFTSMINKPTCYKNLDIPSCIDLILTDCLRSFQNSFVTETGLSDFHKMVVKVMKTTYRKLELRIVHYRVTSSIFVMTILRNRYKKLFHKT